MVPISLMLLASFFGCGFCTMLREYGSRGHRSRPSYRRRGCPHARRRSVMNVIDLPERDMALREDIRLLGRILGDTVRRQQGDAVFATVERIRQISIQFRRDD